MEQIVSWTALKRGRYTDPRTLHHPFGGEAAAVDRLRTSKVRRGGTSVALRPGAGFAKSQELQKVSHCPLVLVS